METQAQIFRLLRGRLYKTFEFEENGDEPVRKRSCTGYEWHPASFSFDVSSAATRALCH